MIRIKFIKVLAFIAVILTAPIWIVKGYLEIGDMVYEAIKEGIKGSSGSE